MPHPADFEDVHGWHWNDAELLFEHQRWAGADQLYGFSAECGLKAVMRALGMAVDPDSVPQHKAHKKHVDRLWDMFLTLAQGPGEARYLGDLPQSNPFQNWSHHDRYANRAHFSADRVAAHRDAAKKVRDMVEKARNEGLL